MAFGWKPTLAFKGPVSLSYRNPGLDSVIEQMLEPVPPTPRCKKLPSSPPPQLVYMGFRPHDSYAMHDSFTRQVSNSYNSNKNYKFTYLDLVKEKYKTVIDALEMKIGDPAEKLNGRPFLGMSPNKSSGFSESLHFDSYFENGNLDIVIQKAEHEYDLYLRPDTNTHGHTLWYYFRVRNTRKANSVRFNIKNLTKPNALYKIGKRPYVFSQLASHVRQA